MYTVRDLSRSLLTNYLPSCKSHRICISDQVQESCSHLSNKKTNLAKSTTQKEGKTVNKTNKSTNNNNQLPTKKLSHLSLTTSQSKSNRA